MKHPVVHVAWSDVEAYAPGGRARRCRPRPSGSRAARGGLDGAEFAGDEFAPGRSPTSPTRGRESSPNENLPPRRSRGDRAGGRTYAAGPYGLFDTIGGAREWTTDWFAPRTAAPAKACCIPSNPRGASEAESYDPHEPEFRIPRKVVKGGSHLCAPNYCRRYRPAARHAQPIDTSMSHVGSRCIVRDGKAP